MAKIQQAVSFSMLQTRKLTKSCGTVREVHFYELEVLNLYLEKTEISGSTIYCFSVIFDEFTIFSLVGNIT